jgi:hypothetical protein
VYSFRLFGFYELDVCVTVHHFHQFAHLDDGRIYHPKHVGLISKD